MSTNGNRAGEGAEDSVGIGINNAAEFNCLAPTTQAAIRIEIVETPPRRGRFTARLGGRVILESSRQPLLDAARILLAGGFAPSTRIAMRHAGENHDALTSTVGAAAKLTVKDGSDGRPRFRPWMPCSLERSSRPVDFPAAPLPTPTPPHAARKSPDPADGRAGVQL